MKSSNDWLWLFPPAMPVAAIPNWICPRLLIPAVGARKRWQFSELLPAYRPSARWIRMARRVWIAAHPGAVRVAPAGEWSLAPLTQAAGVTAEFPVVLIGTAGPAQKVTIQLRDARGRIEGYVKYGESPAARRRLNQESRVLDALPTGVGPRLLRRDALANGEAILLSPLRNGSVPARLPPPPGLQPLLQRLVTANVLPADSHPRVAGWRLQFGSRAESWLSPLMNRYWPIVTEHGDLAPWNLLNVGRGELSAVDWEYGNTSGFPWIDLTYYLLQTGALIHRWTPARAANYVLDFLSRRPWPGLTEREARSVILLTVADSHARMAEDGLPENAPLQNWRRSIWERFACAV